MKTVQSLLEQASAEADHGHFQQARDCYVQALALDAKAGWTWLEYASFLQDRGEWQPALEAATKATADASLGKVRYFAYNIMGNVYEELGDRANAVKAYRKSLELKSWAGTWIYLSSVIAEKYSDDAVIECLQNALALEPDNAEAHYNLGCSYELRSEEQRAEQHLRRCIELDAGYGRAYAELGWVVRQLYPDKLLEARALLEKSLQLNPTYGWASIYLGLILWEYLQEDELAEKTYQAVLKLHPDWSVVYWSYGDCLASTTDNRDLAEEYLRKSVEVDPKDANAYYYLGRHLCVWGDVEQGGNYLMKATQLGSSTAREYLVKHHIIRFRLENI